MKRTGGILVPFLVIALLLHACTYHDINFSDDRPLTIRLNWAQAYQAETKQDVEIGLMWTFSFLGARLEKGSIASAFTWIDKTIEVDVARLGFSEDAQIAWAKLFVVLKNSEEYKLYQSIDVGRFVMLTLNSTNHYYAITGADKTLDEFRSRFTFHKKKAAVLKSSIAHGNRLIELADTTTFDGIAFVAHEGHGSVESNSFVTSEFEIIDLMPNGQLRFALYDLDGSLKTAASASFTDAGKPAKCLWCHETSLQPPFDDDHQLQGYFSTGEFKQFLVGAMNRIGEHRSLTPGDLNFSQQPNHTKAELLYLSYMEPSIERIAAEWRMSVDDVHEMLEGLPTHPHHEFPFLGGKLYHRKDIEDKGPFVTVKTPDNAREESSYEPDLIE